MTSAKRLYLAFASGLALFGTSCGLFNPIPDSTLIQVVGTHHGSVDDDGDYADHGSGDTRQFTTDMGWDIHLTEGYITTAAVTLHNCADEVAEVNLFRGQVAEDITRRPDLEKSAIGTIEVPPVDLCEITLSYGRFDPDESDSKPRSSDVEGTSVFLEGVAFTDVDRVEFQVRIRETIETEIDMTEMNDGDPFRVTGEEPFPIELIIGKTYDQFFDGIDFNRDFEANLEEQIISTLETETTIRVN